MAIQINGDSGISGVNGSAGTPALQGTDSNTGIVFGTDTVQISTGGSTSVTVDSSGRLLAGTTTAGAYSNRRLTVATSSGTTALELRSATNGDSRIVFTDSTSSSDSGAYKGQILYDQSSDYMSFNTNGNNERLRIDSFGRVGIGASNNSSYDSIAQNLLVADESGHAGITIRSGGSTPFGAIHFADGTSSNAEKRAGRIIYQHAIDTLSFNTADNEAMRIDSSGNVGIGVSSLSSSSRLTLLESAGNGQTLEIKGANTGGVGSQPGIKFTASTGDNIGGIFGDTNSDAVVLQSGGTERLRIDSSGNVGIGTSSFTATASGRQILEINGTSSSLINLDVGGTRKAYHFTDGTSVYSYNTANGNYIFGTNDSERMRIDSSGNIKITFPDGNAGLRNKISFVTESPHQDETAYIAANRTAVSSAPTDLVFATGTASGASERMRIDSSGNVGIGTTSPASFLHIDSNNTYGSVVLSRDGGASGRRPFGIGLSGSADDHLRISASSDTTGANAFANQLIEITSEGKVGIGDTSPGGKLDIGFNSSSVVGLVLSNAGTGTSARFYSGSSIVGSITVTGSATAFNTSSDYRLKENVVGITDGITRVKQLSPSRFNFIADDTTTVDGFIAHEAQTVVPEAVTGEKDGEEMQGIDQSKLVPLLTAALQEAIAKIETLEARVTTLEAG